MGTKEEMDVLYASSLRDLVRLVNASKEPIAKEDIVSIQKDDDGIFFLIYYK